MMRIYRDIRFSKDKSPYKTYAAAHFRHANGKDGAVPAYFLHLEPGNSVIGGGIWQPEPKALKKLRDKIAGDPKGGAERPRVVPLAQHAAWQANR